MQDIPVVAEALRFRRHRQPVVSVDAKKKGSVVDAKNAGREWRRRGKPEEVRVHAFIDPNLELALTVAYRYSLQWLIEEYDKCLKAGDSTENRQME